MQLSVRRSAGDVQVEATAAAPRAGLSHHARSPVARTLVGKAAEFLSLAILVTLLPRVLGPEQYGTFALALSVVLIASSAMTLGGAPLMARYVPTVKPNERPALARALALRLAAWRSRDGFSCRACVVARARRAFALPTAHHGPRHDRSGRRCRCNPLVPDRPRARHDVGVEPSLGIAEHRARRGDDRRRRHLREDAAVAGVTLASGSALVLAAATVGRSLVGAHSGASIPEGALRFGLLQGISGFLILVTHRGGVVAVAVVGGSAVETGHAALAIGVALAATYMVFQAFISQLPGLAADVRDDPLVVEVRARRLGWAALITLLPFTAFAAVELDWLVPRVFGEEFGSAEDAFAVALAAVPLAPLTALGMQLVSLRLFVQEGSSLMGW